MRDGMAQVYEAIRGEFIESASTAGSTNPLEDAVRLAELGDLGGAYTLLRDASERDPANLVLHAALVQRHQEWLKGSVALAQTQYESKDFEGAMATLEAMRVVDGRNPTVISLLNQARLERAKQVWQQATTAMAKGDTEGASKAFLEATRLQPLATEPRTQLAQLFAKRAAAADREAENHKARGDWTTAILAMERAQSLHPTPERAAHIVQAQRDFEFEQGMAFYHAKQYPQAIFQFQKVLGQNPNHAEAKKHLQYAQRLAQDTNSDLLQDRFSRLE
jgi:tetratricopeptide (TPR) repeat protein